MADLPGYSFAPTFANAEMGKRGGLPAQDAQGALRTINYSLPKVTGAASLSPLVATGGGSPFGNAVLQSVLRTILGSDAADAIGGGGAGTDTYGGWQAHERDLGSGVIGRALGQGRGTPGAPRIHVGLLPGEDQPSGEGGGAASGAPYPDGTSADGADGGLFPKAKGPFETLDPPADAQTGDGGSTTSDTAPSFADILQDKYSSGWNPDTFGG